MRSPYRAPAGPSDAPATGRHPGVRRTEPSADLVVGIDVATHAVRALCADPGGVVLAATTAPLADPYRPMADRSEQDAEQWWTAAAAALRELTGRLGPARRRIRALSIAATSGTVVLTDHTGVSLGPALMYDDRRGAEFSAKAAAAEPVRWDQLGSRPAATSAIGRIAWLIAHDGAAAGRRICHTPDLLVWRLTGTAPPTDSSHALKSGYDPLAGEWAARSLAAAGVDPALLPPVLPPTTPVGTVRREVAEATGLPVGCEVRLGMTDGCAGQIACGASALGSFVSVLGTTLVLKGVSATLIHDPDDAIYSHRHPDGTWLPGGASNTGGEALDRYQAERLAALDVAAADHGPARTLSYPLRRAGERFPFTAPDARGFTRGQPDHEVERYRADLEGVAFLERLAYDRIGALGVPVIDSITTAGRAATSRVWRTIRATVLDHPLRTVAEGNSAFGAAVLAAAGTVHPDLRTATARMVHEGDVVDPAPAESGALEESYRRFREELAARGWIAD